MHPVRRRRLFSDFEALQALCRASEGRIQLESATGDPPESYVLLLYCRSLSTLDRDTPIFTQHHRIQLHCPAAYPAQPPFASMLSPALHPHIYPDRTFCLGSWRPQEKLDSLLLRIGAILCYDPAAINPRSVANDEAAIWARRNKAILPLDPEFLSLLAMTGPSASV